MTRDDLAQIGELFDRKLEQKLEEKLEQKLNQKFDEKLAPIHQELKKHGKMLKSLKKDQDTMLDMLDKEQMSQRKRLAHIEKHLIVTSAT